MKIADNHGKKLKEDPRRNLYLEFLKFVEFFRPKIFVMENVLGIRTTEGGKHLAHLQHLARSMGRGNGSPGYRVHGQVENAWELGVPQKRRRLLIIGVRPDLPEFFLPQLDPAPRAVPRITLGAAIAKEAWRRFKNKQLVDEEFYCSDAVVAGMCYRNPCLRESVRENR